MDEKLIKQAFDARMKRRRIELEAKYGLEFSTSGGGACYPSGLSGGGDCLSGFPSGVCVLRQQGRGPRICRDRLSRGDTDPGRIASCLVYRQVQNPDPP